MRCVLLSSVLVMSAMSLAAAPKQNRTVIPLPPSGEGVAQAINARGDIVGTFRVSPQYVWLSSFFYQPKGGQATLFDAPHAIETAALDINARGQIVGQYFEYGVGQRGFVWRPEGEFRAIDAPGCSATAIRAINSRGTMVGDCSDRFAFDQVVHGFRIDKGRFQPVVVDPEGVTIPTGIASDGTIVGFFGGMFGDDPRRGFILRRGSITFVDYPNAASTYLQGIAPNGRAAVGFAFVPDLGYQGFIYCDGRFSAIEGLPYGINNSGAIVGWDAGRAFVWRHARTRTCSAAVGDDGSAQIGPLVQ